MTTVPSMLAAAHLLLLVALPALLGGGVGDGEVVSVTTATGPRFTSRQRVGVVAARGSHATLECRVVHLADKSVSWVRSRDLQILTHAGAVFTADARVSAAESAAGGGAGGGAGVTRHSLRIERLRLSDSGRYECQVNTEPKMSLFFNLTVLDEEEPEVVVSAVGDASVWGRVGSTVSLSCEARYRPEPRALPLPPLELRWRREGTPDLQLQTSRGGVSLDTERWGARLLSTLTLRDLAPEDAGRYTCAAGSHAATLTLQLRTEEHMEMQRDQAGSGAGGGGGGGNECLVALLVVAVSHGH